MKVNIHIVCPSSNYATDITFDGGIYSVDFDSVYKKVTVRYKIGNRPNITCSDDDWRGYNASTTPGVCVFYDVLTCHTEEYWLNTL